MVCGPRLLISTEASLLQSAVARWLSIQNVAFDIIILLVVLSIFGYLGFEGE